jgi:NADH:ubiquinone oxidoreductase subunit F (NADH-binding)
VFNRIAQGDGLGGDVQLVESICSQVAGHTICAFGEALSWPAQAFIRKFPEEFKGKIGNALVGIRPRRESLNFEFEGAKH